MAMLVRIRRQFNDRLIAATSIEKISNFHWATQSGGVKSISPQYFIHGFVFCTEIIGKIAHSCKHGPPPHSIKIVILKKDNKPDVYERISGIAGPRPVLQKAKPYNPKVDASEICTALLEEREHPGIEFKNHKVMGNIYVIKPKNLARLTADGTENTIRNRSKRLQEIIKKALQSSELIEEVPYGYWLTYRKRI